MNIPRGQRYELCRSVHAEENAIISASRRDMMGATLYLAGKDVETGEYVAGASSCAMCKRAIINSGITKMIFRDTKDTYRTIMVQELIDNDDSLDGTLGY